ncbi:VWA domain-containing protein [Streptomyces sp. TRM S81-3]|uniref:VWA domain-containing protein n=1 Tax=Streptomyces griseicoloratus TaxID=2752516 RepID=A0A926QU16_9ACTN|nr:VWA domain-containing protein [Streptomyces griseicoloratus]MBD0423686.1 VWA domain-containing protein [Streptomyces griseicoloratus]
MGILSLLRNAFGRSRRARAAQAEDAPQESAAPAAQDTAPATPEATVPPQPTASPEPAEPAESAPRAHVPEPRAATGDEHELVAAAFDNVTVPKPSQAPDDRTPTEPAPEPALESAPEPEAATAPPTTEPETAPEAAEPRPESTPEAAEPNPEPAPEAAETETPEAPAAEPQPEPEPTPQPEAQPEPEAAAQPEPQPTAAAPTPEPAAAAGGEDTPQGPPAPEGASSTGGAGGNTKAEGEAEAAPEAAEPEAPAPDDEGSTGGAGGNTEAEGEAEAAPPKPATPAARIRTRAPGLTTAYKAAGTALKKHSLTGTRAKVHLVLDRSASMRPYYKDGSAQALAEQTLALAAHLDPEATVHVTFFSTDVDGTGELTLTDHENKIDELHGTLGRMGRTSYHAAVEAVLAHHEKEAPGTPALVVFQTDGAPDAKTPATQSLTDAAKHHPDVFFAFVAFGDPENKAFDYLRKLKTPNTSHFLAGETPRELTDKELYEGLLASWRP